MARYLVVANLTLGGEALLATLRDRVAGGGARIHILVPATSDPATWHLHAEEEEVAAARQRLEAAKARFADLGADDVTGEVGALQPVYAIGDVLTRERDDPFEEIILSTLPPGPSKWLRMDLPHRVARAYELPVTHVEARATEEV